MNTVTELKTYKTNVDYNNDIEILNKFILFYNKNEEYIYLDQIREHSPSISISLDDISLFDETNIIARIEKNAYSYLELLYKIIDSIVFSESEFLLGDNEDDLFFYHRISRFKEKYPDSNITDHIPSFLLRNYFINLIPRKGSRIFSVRQIKSEHIGSLIKVSGVVTRVSQIKPSIRVATYACESCGSEIYQQITGDVFDMLEECTSEKCRSKNVRGTLILINRGSKFLKHQTMQIQELTSDVPFGCVPRLINIDCYGPTTEKCMPGDVAIISGIYLPKPYFGIKKLKAGLLTDTYLLATDVLSTKIETENLKTLNITHPVDSIVRSIAPEIYGMMDIKKIILLMLVGAPDKVKDDGMKIRGNINCLLLGDPGIAKSQLLKTAVKISKRGVYTTGRGASGVGLTASVIKDKVTNEVILEGGALVLSDKGICCIDELDKMTELDRVSIHEVMEQQSVSISKAGINTTLNARCSVLGAANPIKGRYDPRYSVEYNVGLPCSLLSRFDIIVVLKDEADATKDMELAQHVTSIHYNEDEASSISYREIRAYIEKAKTIDPVLPASLSEKLVEFYLDTRKDNENTTPRYLLSLIRLSLAHARLRLSDVVTEEDINETTKLMQAMKIPVIKNRSEPVSIKRRIYNLILSCVYKEDNEKKYVKLDDLWAKCQGLYSVTEVEDTISSFSSCGIWIRTDDEIIILE